MSYPPDQEISGTCTANIHAAESGVSENRIASQWSTVCQNIYYKFGTQDKHIFTTHAAQLLCHETCLLFLKYLRNISLETFAFFVAFMLCPFWKSVMSIYSPKVIVPVFVSLFKQLSDVHYWGHILSIKLCNVQQSIIMSSLLSSCRLMQVLNMSHFATIILRALERR